MPSNSYANKESDGIGFFTRNVLLILSLRTDKTWNSPVVTPSEQFQRQRSASMSAMSQDSDTGLTAEQLDAKYGDSQDGARTPPKVDGDEPAWLDEAAAMLNKPTGPSANNPSAAAPGAVPPPLLPIRSEFSQLAEQMGGAAVSAPSAAPPDNGPAGPSKTAAPGGKPGGKPDDTSADDSDDEYLTQEEKEKAEHVKKVEAVIAAAEGAGFTFIAKTRWLAAEAYVNNKKLFDDAGVDITECIKQDSKAINSKRVNAKIAELREAAAAVVTTYQGGLSQENIGDEDEDEEEEDAAESDDEYGGLSKQSLDAKLEQLTIELAVAEKKEKMDPIRLAFRQFNKELITLKGSLQYDGKAKELTMIRDYYNEQYFEKDFVASLSVWQMEYMAAMWNAEIEKRALPSTIKDLRKHLGKVTSALRDIKFEQMEKQDAKKTEQRGKRTAAAIEKAINTPGKRPRR
jgi:hypothetical protein